MYTGLLRPTAEARQGPAGCRVGAAVAQQINVVAFKVHVIAGKTQAFTFKVDRKIKNRISCAIYRLTKELAPDKANI